jgi:tripartite-type tricarboxylate transporter receptor subunit TctC
VINSPPDGYTLLFYGASTVVNTSIFHNLPFDVRRDIAPVCGLVVYPMVLVAHPSLPARSVAELIAHAKANPGKVTMASFGTGSASHLAGELFQDDGRDQHGPRPLSRRRADGDRSDRWTGAGWI